MPKNRLTNLDVVDLLSSQSGLTTEQVKSVLRAQAELAYSHAARGYPVPGIGTLAMVERPERRGRNPKTLEEIVIRAKKALKFRVSRMAKDTVLGRPESMPDIFKPLNLPEFKLRTDAIELTDPAMFLDGLEPFTNRDGESPVQVNVQRLPDLSLATGRIVAADFMIGGPPFVRNIAPGTYPLALVVTQDDRVALAVIRFSDRKVVNWELAIPEGQENDSATTSHVGYGVDSGTGSFCDASLLSVLELAREEGVELWENICAEMTSRESPKNWIHLDSQDGSLAVFSSGGGDGFYSSFFGLDALGDPVALVTDFQLLRWRHTTRR